MDTAGPRQSSLRGIALVVVAMMLFAWMDALSKQLVQTYAVTQVVWVRFLFFALIALAFNLKAGVVTALRSHRPWLQIGRSLLLVTEISLVVFAIRDLPLADIHAIFALTPLLVTALSVPMLGEQVGIRRWSAVGAGFVGMLVILRPGFGVMHPAALVALFASLLFAVYQIVTRIAAQGDSPSTTTLYTALVGAVALTAVGPLHWRTPTPVDWVMFAALAAVGAAGHYVLIFALRLATASLLQPFTYTAILWATLVGYVVFDEFPDGPTLAGAAIIVASGLYAINRERLRARAEKATDAAGG